MKRSALLLCLLVLVAAGRPQCDRRVSFQQCADVTLHVDPGGCVDFAVDCDPSWEHLGTVALYDTFAGLWLEVERRPASNRVRLCAAPDMRYVPGEQIEFIYTDTDGVAWVGVADVSVGEPFEVSLSADPKAIHQGETSQLHVTVTGGAPPYEYHWSYSESFIGPYDIADPVVKPPVGEVFGLSVHDANGQRESASALVDVVPVVAVVAVPDTIDAGGVVTLGAGVNPNFPDGTRAGWTWSPDLPSGKPANTTTTPTTATPQVTTVYMYTFRTFYGTPASDSVTVYVRP